MTVNSVVLGTFPIGHFCPVGDRSSLIIGRLRGISKIIEYAFLKENIILLVNCNKTCYHSLLFSRINLDLSSRLSYNNSLPLKNGIFFIGNSQLLL